MRIIRRANSHGENVGGGHVGTLPHCHALRLSVREISVAAGTGADVMASGALAGAAGAAPDVRHQPPRYTDLC